MDEELEYFTHFLTVLCKTVNPKVDEGETYNVLYQMMYDLHTDKGLSLKDAKKIGRKINKTENSHGLNRDRLN
jgi:hypothetical protein